MRVQTSYPTVMEWDLKNVAHGSTNFKPLTGLDKRYADMSTQLNLRTACAFFPRSVASKGHRDGK